MPIRRPDLSVSLNDLLDRDVEETLSRVSESGSADPLLSRYLGEYFVPDAYRVMFLTPDNSPEVRFRSLDDILGPGTTQGLHVAMRAATNREQALEFLHATVGEVLVKNRASESRRSATSDAAAPDAFTIGDSQADQAVSRADPDQWVRRLGWLLRESDRSAMLGDILERRAKLRGVGLPEREVTWDTVSELVWIIAKRLRRAAWVLARWAGVLMVGEVVKAMARSLGRE